MAERKLISPSFTAQIRLHSILLRTSTTSSAPQTLKLFLNRDDLDFSTAASLPATQTLELAQSNEVQEVPVKRALFNTVRSLDLFFEEILDYSRRLCRAGVPVELHSYPGAVHAFDMVASARVSRQFQRDLDEALSRALGS